MYLNADSISRILGMYIKVEGVYLEKDFENMRLLVNNITHLHFVRTANVDPNSGSTRPQDWDPDPEGLNQSFEYIKQLLNDLDVAINKNGSGVTYGVSFYGDGDKVEELNSFLATGSN